MAAASVALGYGWFGQKSKVLESGRICLIQRKTNFLPPNLKNIQNIQAATLFTSVTLLKILFLMLLLCQRAGNLWFLVICWWAPMKMNFWGWVRQGGWLQLELNYYLMIQSSCHLSPPSEISMFYQYMRKPLRIHHGFSLGRQFTPHTDTNQYMCTQVL